MRPRLGHGEESTTKVTKTTKKTMRLAEDAAGCGPVSGDPKHPPLSSLSFFVSFATFVVNLSFEPRTARLAYAIVARFSSQASSVMSTGCDPASPIGPMTPASTRRPISARARW